MANVANGGGGGFDITQMNQALDEATNNRIRLQNRIEEIKEEIKKLKEKKDKYKEFKKKVDANKELLDGPKNSLNEAKNNLEEYYQVHDTVKTVTKIEDEIGRINSLKGDMAELNCRADRKINKIDKKIEEKETELKNVKAQLSNVQGRINYLGRLIAQNNAKNFM